MGYLYLMSDEINIKTSRLTRHMLTGQATVSSNMFDV